jgi:predicted 3-demethylubiquinone-9 3-methyltransferase (glyoxalase superfamily)
MIPYLWFEHQAGEAASFYVNLFRDSSITGRMPLGDGPSGPMEVVTFNLMGLPYMAISGGPQFQITPAISLFVYCETEAEIDRIYSALMEGGEAMMPLDAYPWSPKYAWVMDRFGVSWQLDVEAINNSQKIVPALMFANRNKSKVKEASEFYRTIFPNSISLMEATYEEMTGSGGDDLIFAQFKLNGYIFNAMSNDHPHGFDFTEGFSFMVYCGDQQEVDHYWYKLSKGGEQQMCGWLKDRYGVSWQIIPKDLDRMMSDPDPVKRERVQEVILKSRKLDLGELMAAYNSGPI